MKKIVWFLGLVLGTVLLCSCSKADSITRDEKPIDGKKQVSYVDYRNKNVAVIYTDWDIDGWVDQVRYEGLPIISFTLVNCEEEAETANAKLFGGESRAARVVLWTKSPDAEKLQEKYQSVIRGYIYSHPADNQLAEAVPVYPMAHPAKIDGVEKWLDEYLLRQADWKRSFSDQNELGARYRMRLAEMYLIKSYDALEDADRDALFDFNRNAGHGIYVGEKLGQTLKEGSGVWMYWLRNPRRDLEKSFAGRSALDSIGAGEKFLAIKAAYDADLVKRGFVLPK